MVSSYPLVSVAPGIEVIPLVKGVIPLRRALYPDWETSLMLTTRAGGLKHPQRRRYDDVQLYC